MLPNSQRREDVIFDLHNIQEMREGMMPLAVFPVRLRKFHNRLFRKDEGNLQVLLMELVTC